MLSAASVPTHSEHRCLACNAATQPHCCSLLLSCLLLCRCGTLTLCIGKLKLLVRVARSSNSCTKYLLRVGCTGFCGGASTRQQTCTTSHRTAGPVRAPHPHDALTVRQVLFDTSARHCPAINTSRPPHLTPSTRHVAYYVYTTRLQHPAAQLGVVSAKKQQHSTA